MNPAPLNPDAYIAAFPEPTRSLLQQLRETIRAAAPLAEEVISYGMPAYKYKGVLVYFAGYKGHIGFYPTGSGITQFAAELAAWKTSKGTVQFPLDAPLPLALITRMVQYRVQENEEKARLKQQARRSPKQA